MCVVDVVWVVGVFGELLGCVVFWCGCWYCVDGEGVVCVVCVCGYVCLYIGVLFGLLYLFVCMCVWYCCVCVCVVCVDLVDCVVFVFGDVVYEVVLG